jgi:tape measure domain-containing protein
MPIVSSNEIHVKYTLDVGQLQAATAAMSQITAEERKLLADLKKLQDQLNDTGKAGKGAGNDIAGSFGNIGSVVKQLIPVFSVAFAVDKLKQFATYAFETAKQFEQMSKTLAFVTGSSQKANEQLSYMTALSQTLGLNVRSLADGFKGFAAAASFAGVSQENINRQMVGFTKAAAALSLSAEDTKLMFNALSQMYSKNKIQAEELRGQLGERLPGAMELLAKSMGKPVTALDEMLKKGEIITKDVMPAFAKEVELAFGIAAAQTDTLTAAQNRMMTAFETAAVRVMEGGIGDMIKFIMNRLAAISDFIKWFNQNTAENLEDFFNKRKANVQQNVLFEIEAERKKAKEKEGIELTAAQAAERILNDERRGYAAHAKYIKDVYSQAFEEAGQVHKNKVGLLGMIDDIKRFSAKAGAVTKGLGNTLLSPLEVLSKGSANVLRENIMSAINALNKETQAEVDLSNERINSLNYFAEKAKQEQKAIDEAAADEAAKSAKNRYQKELQMLELQERIRKFYAEASIEDEFARSQELLKIAAVYNEKKKAIDNKYFKESFANESQGMKDLRELTKNNADLRVAESASMYADIRRNEDKYHEEAYNKEKKALDKLTDEREKNALKQAKKGDLTFDDELKIINDKYDKMITAARNNSYNIIANDGLTEAKRRELLDANYALLNNLHKDKNNETLALQTKYHQEFLDEAEKYFAELDKLRKEDFERAKRDFEAQAQLTTTNMETRMLAERNALRGGNRPGDQQQMALLDKQQNQERIENQIETLQQQYELNRTFADVDSVERKKEQQQILADIRSLEEQKTSIQLDYAQQRKNYEIEILKESAELASQITSGLVDNRIAQLDNELTVLQRNAQEEIRLADGNKQQIMAIEERTRQKEREIKKEQFRAQQTAAVADVIFRTAPIIAQYSAGIVTAPLAIIAGLAAAAQIGFILAQPVPEFRKGTQGKPHKGGPAIVGEEGVEKVITESGRVYYTPPTATLLDLPKGSHVIPNNMLNKQEVYWASSQSASGSSKPKVNGIEVKLDEIGSILKTLPVHQINMDERGFEKFVRTERRTTKILNNRFPAKNK